jgi:hypothetical protein
MMHSAAAGCQNRQAAAAAAGEGNTLSVPADEWLSNMGLMAC